MREEREREGRTHSGFDNHSSNVSGICGIGVNGVPKNHFQS